mmetsp:Transcript_68260/g.113461  ORF Transcript_68260/g.113461 Transcript_68260/m.113461 type:complete len:226 (-) Transcript_68260:1384-2061(-)
MLANALIARRKDVTIVARRCTLCCEHTAWLEWRNSLGLVRRRQICGEVELAKFEVFWLAQLLVEPARCLHLCAEKRSVMYPLRGGGGRRWRRRARLAKDVIEDLVQLTPIRRLEEMIRFGQTDPSLELRHVHRRADADAEDLMILLRFDCVGGNAGGRTLVCLAVRDEDDERAVDTFPTLGVEHCFGSVEAGTGICIHLHLDGRRDSLLKCNLVRGELRDGQGVG